MFAVTQSKRFFCAELAKPESLARPTLRVADLVRVGSGSKFIKKIIFDFDI